MELNVSEVYVAWDEATLSPSTNTTMNFTAPLGETLWGELNHGIC